MFPTPGTRANRQSFSSLLLRRLPRLNMLAPSDGVELFAQRRAGRQMAAQVGPSGRWYELQSALGSNRIGFTSALGGATTVTNVGIGTPTVSGTATTRSVANTSMLAASRRVGYVIASAAANQPTGWGLNGSLNTVWRGNATGLGGFFFATRFGFNAFTGGAGGNRAFVGLSASAWTSGDPSAVVNMIGVGFDSGDANFYVMNNDSSGTATKNDTGIAIAADKLYEVRVFCAANGAQIFVSLERLDDGALFEAGPLVTDIPVATSFLMGNVRANSGSSATTGAAIDIVGAYIETDS